MTDDRPRVLVCDELAAEALELLEQQGMQVELAIGSSEDQLVARAPGHRAMIVRSATRITRRVLEAAVDLRVVGRAGVGVDNVDCDAATERGVVVMNTPDGNTISAAELAIAHLLALARNLVRADRAARGGFQKKGLLGTEITGKTLGVIGLGRIGRAVAERGLGLKLRVIAHDPYLDPRLPSPVEGVERVELDELLASSDFVTLHVPLSDATRDLLSRERLQRMKRGARLINAARGGLVDEQALAELLASGHLRGAALDVFAKEPPPPDHPLLSRDDVTLSPHLGASSHEAQRNVGVEIAKQIAEYLETGVARNAVNAPAIAPDELRELAPYVLLAEKLGSLLAQRAQRPLRTIELSTAGRAAKFDPAHLRTALLVGVLRHSTGSAVNFVNAGLLAREHGVEIVDVRPGEHGEHAHRIEARTLDAEGGSSAVGAVYGRVAKLVEIDGVALDLEPKGSILITRHRDQPGVVGVVGTLLGQHGVNIRRIELGPLPGSRRAVALGFWSLYQAPDAALLRALAALEPLEAAEHVSL